MREISIPEYLNPVPKLELLPIVNGAEVRPSGPHRQIIDPGSAKPLVELRDSDAAQVDAALAAAHNSFEAGVWRNTSWETRAKTLWNIAERLEKNRHVLAELETLDQGMPIAMGDGMVSHAVRAFRYYAGLAGDAGFTGFDEYDGELLRVNTVIRQPIGVCVLIVPWNAPLMLLATKLAPALAAGCSVVVKPSETTPLSALLVARICEQAGLPPGVMNVVLGDAVVGTQLVSDPRVRKVSFTGSTAVGRSIVKQVSEDLTKVTLELGGKSPVLVFEDADLDKAATGAVAAILGNTGQVCTAGSRLYVHENVKEELLERIVAKFGEYRIGHGLDPRTRIGPLTSLAHRDRVLRYMELGVDEAADRLIGGEAFGPGYFLSPTVFVDPSDSARIAREEIFGPVLTAFTFSSTEEAVRRANSSSFGLAASVWTENIGLAQRVGRQLEAGRVGINVHATPDVRMPTGGFKESGWGRELGHAGLDSYTETKSLVYQV